MNLAQKICDRVGIIINGKMIENDLINNILEKHYTNDLEEVFFNLYKQEVGE